MLPSGDGYERYREDYVQNISFALEDDIRDLGRNIKFIDIGSGPYSRCGFVSNILELRTLAVDLLAKAYQIMREKTSIDSPIKQSSGFLELLSTQFQEGEFDCVHMSNSLDHCFDPIFGLHQLLYICRIGGKVILRHYENEAENEKYSGFHQWNISCRNDEGSLVIWRGDIKYNVCELLARYGDFEIFPELVENGWNHNKVIITKKQIYLSLLMTIRVSCYKRYGTGMSVQKQTML